MLSPEDGDDVPEMSRSQYRIVPYGPQKLGQRLVVIMPNAYFGLAEEPPSLGACTVTYCNLYLRYARDRTRIGLSYRPKFFAVPHNFLSHRTRSLRSCWS